MARFIHTADWQLGMTRHFLGPDAQSRFTAARIEAIRTIGSLALAERCSFVVVCGDVFETNHVERQVIVRSLEAMAATPSVTFYLLPGNHDPLDASSVFRSSTFRERQPANVVVLDRPGVLPIEPGVELVAAPWSSKRPLQDLVGAVCTDLPVDGTVRVVVGHGAVDTLSPDRHNPALIRLAELEAHIDSGQVHYAALGDRHSSTDVGRTGKVWYAGAPEPTDYTEVDPGNILLVDASCERTRVEVRRVAGWRFVRRQFDLAGPADCERLEAWMDALVDKDRTIVKLALVGQLSLADKARLDRLLAGHADLFAALETWDLHHDLVVLPDDDDLTDLLLSGFAREALIDLRDLAARNDDAPARAALGLLYRLGTAQR